ncbi:MAG: hypothetical protein QXE92_00300 [Thermofilaceae archaeon]
MFWSEKAFKSYAQALENILKTFDEIAKKQQQGIKELYILEVYGDLLCAWEKGGAGCNTGSATVIAGSQGEAKKAIKVRTSGHLAGREHALIPVEIGDHIIFAFAFKRKCIVEIYRVVGFDVARKAIISKKVVEVEGQAIEEVLQKLPENLVKAASAAIAKAHCYHCREPHYIAK